MKIGLAGDRIFVKSSHEEKEWHFRLSNIKSLIMYGKDIGYILSFGDGENNNIFINPKNVDNYKEIFDAALKAMERGN